MTNDLTYHCFPKIDTYIDVACYDCSQHADHKLNKWVMNDARYCRFKPENIYCFRDAVDSDKREYLLSNTIVPTEYCIMECYDEWEKKRKNIMVVGNADDLNKRLAKIALEVSEKNRKLYEVFKTF